MQETPHRFGEGAKVSAEPLGSRWSQLGYFFQSYPNRISMPAKRPATTFWAGSQCVLARAQIAPSDRRQALYRLEVGTTGHTPARADLAKLVGPDFRKASAKESMLSMPCPAHSNVQAN
jgi:hypothetical protein